MNQRVFNGLQDHVTPGPLDPPTTPSSSLPQCSSQNVEDLAIIARWGPAFRPDYTLDANGGKVVPTLTSSDRSRRRAPSAAPGPEVVISEDSSIGNCWTPGVSGQVGLSTTTVIYPTHVTVEHIPRQIAVDVGRAPRHMILWGVIDGLSNVHKHRWLIDNREMDISPDSSLRGHHAPPLTDNHAFVVLAAIEYNISGPSPVQTFAVHDRILDSQMDFGIYVLEIIDNWGSSDTCLYRVQIHGEPASLDTHRER
ncbi:hypothetical protein C8Q70DRAFT_925457 [Cubamyces menziesii]|nr:hypothetical protein C8Q70DRAFT_925457 [Cubamyces menziesii]